MFNPTYTAFLDRGKPRAELYWVSDGLHLNGAGVDRLEAAISQGLSMGYLLEIWLMALRGFGRFAEYAEIL